MIKSVQYFLVAIFSSLSLISLGQKGPGGVTDDSDDQKNCRLWLDAGDLNLADQDDILLWLDRSVSDVVDEAFWDSTQNYLPPIFRNDPSNGINGKPVISFEDGGMLSIGEWPGGDLSEDLNTNPNKRTTYKQSIFIVFRTSNDVSNRQILWEEGGFSRGFNIQIFDGFLYIGAYDDNLDGENVTGGGDLNIDIYPPVPRFGYSYKRLPLQPNTTFVLSMVYDVSTENELLNPANSDFSGLTGTLNGTEFPYQLENGCCEDPGVGGIYTHPDAIGIGGLNGASYNENGPIPGSPTTTGSFNFTGRLAEICYYAFAISPCERIIIENYLAAKYFANVINNDKFDYQTSFGEDVIGIGKENDSDTHNVSQGDNLFEISVDNLSVVFPNNEPYYLLVGHNDNPLVWTKQNVPDTLTFQRLRRMWRFDRHGPTNGDRTVHLEIDPADMPPLPTGFTEYGIIVDNSNGPLPNFGSEDAQIIGLATNAEGKYECEAEIEKGSYLTIAAILPAVSFSVSSESIIEGDDPPDPFYSDSIIVELNYLPPFGVSYDATIAAFDGTAIQGVDYNWPSSNSPLTFSPGIKSRKVEVQILNDLDESGDDPIEKFDIVITSGTGGLTVGERDSIVYKILDNDPPPKLTFESATYTVNESSGQVKIPLEIIGSFSGNPTAQVSIKSEGTTTFGADFTMVDSQTLSFSPTTPRDSVIFTTIDDQLDEFDESFILEITGANGIGFDDTLNAETEIVIVDNDLPPTVNFLAASSEGYEGIGDPRIYVVLSAPSAKQIQVPFEALSTGTATNGAIEGNGSDYEAELNSTLIIPPGDTLSFIYYDIPTNETNFIVNSDEEIEPDESAIFALGENPINAQLGSLIQHTYFIRDYVEFDNRGIAGVGKKRDNTIIMVADEAVSSGNIPNLSPRNIEMVQNDPENQPSIQNDALNGKSVLHFDGNDLLAVGDPGTPGQSSLINTAGFYDGKSIFLVITPENAGSTTAQMIYEQGGKSKGLALYIQNNKLYFQGLNPANEGDYSPWGADTDDLAIVESTISLQDNQSYIISAHFSNNLFPVPPDTVGLKLYVNGELQGSYSGDVGRLYTHTGRAAIGGIWNNSFTFEGSIETFNGFSNFYQGDIAELIYFNEPNRTDAVRMNEARINLIHNHLSAKYNIPLNGANQYFDINTNGNASSPNYFGFDVAGVASIGDRIHGDSRGNAQLRLHIPNFSGSGDYHAVWGHQGEEMTDTWPVSYWNASIEQPVQERSGRIWKFFTNANDGELKAQIEINYSESSNADTIEPIEDQLLRLLIHQNTDPDDFSSIDTILIPEPSNLDGNTVIFQDVPIKNGMYLALGNTSTINNLPLPIELFDFRAELVGSQVELSWQTLSEINNDYFVVERSGENLIWEPVLQKQGAGNSTSRLFYSATDDEPLSGISYYRLKQIDYDGSFTYSEPVSVSNESDDLWQVGLFPNPSTLGVVTLHFSGFKLSQSITATLSTISGKQLKSEIIQCETSHHQYHYGDLPPGIYLLMVCSPDRCETLKLAVE